MDATSADIDVSQHREREREDARRERHKTLRQRDNLVRFLIEDLGAVPLKQILDAPVVVLEERDE